MKFKFKLLSIITLMLIVTNSKDLFAQKLEYNELYSSSTIVMDLDSNAILFNKNGDKRVYPASTTKIITAIVAIENLDINTPITSSSSALYTVPSGSSTMYLKVGEVMSLKNLLYGLLVKSGNDAGNVIAEAVSSDIDTFVKKMNEKVEEIGCTNTHFTNTHGFHDEEHYTTAYDMAKIMKYCLNNETFKSIISTQKYTIEKTNKTDYTRNIVSTNKMYNKNYKDMYYEYVIGGKTGYTDEAQGTFVGYLKKDDKNIIVATFDAPQDINGNEARFLDTIKVSEYIFDNFSKSTIISKDNFKFSLVDKENKKKYTIGIKNDVTTLSDNEIYRISYDIYDLIGKNYNVNNSIGTLNIISKNSDENFYFNNFYNLEIISEEEYKYFNFYKYLNKLIILLIILFIVLIIIEKSQNKPNKKKFKKTKFKDRDLKRINR